MSILHSAGLLPFGRYVLHTWYVIGVINAAVCTALPLRQNKPLAEDHLHRILVFVSTLLLPILSPLFSLVGRIHKARGPMVSACPFGRCTRVGGL